MKKPIIGFGSPMSVMQYDCFFHSTIPIIKFLHNYNYVVSYIMVIVIKVFFFVDIIEEKMII